MSLQAGSQARTSGNTCSPPWEWRSASPEGGRGGRAAGAQSLHYVSGLQMCADVATPRPGPQLVWTGPRGPGEPRNEISSPALPAAPRPAAPLSSSLPPFPLLPAPGHFAGLVAGSQAQVGGLERAPAWQPCLQTLTPTCLSSSCCPSGLSPQGGSPQLEVSPAPQCCRRCSGFWDQSLKPSSSSSSGASEGFRLRLKEPHRVLRAGPGHEGPFTHYPHPSSLPQTLGSRGGRPCLPEAAPHGWAEPPHWAGLCLPHSLELPEAKIFSPY